MSLKVTKKIYREESNVVDFCVKHFKKRQKL